MNIESAQTLVTGGSSGIGYATAKLLVERGARVAICGRDRAKSERAAGEIGALAIHADVSGESALRGMTECWRAELRKSNVRVMLINPSEVQTAFSGGRRTPSPRKLQAIDIAEAMVSMLEIEDRGFVTEMAVWATNPE